MGFFKFVIIFMCKSNCCIFERDGTILFAHNLQFNVRNSNIENELPNKTTYLNYELLSNQKIKLIFKSWTPSLVYRSYIAWWLNGCSTISLTTPLAGCWHKNQIALAASSACTILSLCTFKSIVSQKGESTPPKNKLVMRISVLFNSSL